MSNAHAVLINDASNDFTVNWSSAVGTNTLSASALFDVTSVSATQVVINIFVANNSTLTTLVNAGLASFGLEISPTATSLSHTGGSANLNQSIANIPSINNIDLCLWYGNSCNGGPQGQLLAVGFSDSFTLTINGSFLSGLDVLDNGIKFQTSAGSYEFHGAITDCTVVGRTCLSQQTPEPSTLLLFAAALASLGAIKRRQAKR